MSETDEKGELLKELRFTRGIFRTKFTKKIGSCNQHVKEETIAVDILRDDIKSLEKHAETEETKTMEILKILGHGEEFDKEFSDHESRMDDGERCKQKLLVRITELMVSASTQNENATITTNSERHRGRENDPGANSQAKFAEKPEKITQEMDYVRFTQWRKSFNRYLMLTGISKKSEAEQVRNFAGFCDLDTSLKFEHVLLIDLDNTELTLQVVLDRFEQSLRDERNLVANRLQLLRLKKEKTEKFDDYWVRLKTSGNNCDIHEMTSDDWYVTLITAQIDDDEIRKNLLAKNPPLNLTETLKFCREQENARRHGLEISGTKIGAMNKGKKNKWRSRSKSKPRGDSNGNKKQEKKDCYRCGEKWPHESNSPCKALTHKCGVCQNTGHFDKFCKTKQGKRDVKTNAIKINAIRTGDQLSVIIGNDKHQKEHLSTADTGAGATVSGTGLMKTLGLKRTPLVNQTANLESVTKESMRTICERTLTISIVGGRTIKELVHFSPDVDEDDLYIGREACKKLGLVHKDFPQPLPDWFLEETSIGAISKEDKKDDAFLGESDGFPQEWKDTLNQEVVATIASTQRDSIPTGEPTDKEVEKIEADLREEFKEVFSTGEGLPMMKGEPMKIILKQDAVPHADYAVRRIPITYREKAKEALEKMCADGIIEKVIDRPTPWLHPLHVVPKPNGEVRITVDLSRLNENVERVIYPCPTPKDAIASIDPKAKWLTTMDCTSGYFQLPLHEDSCDLTCFLTPWGVMRFKRSPMGFVNSGDYYCQRGDLALKGLEGVQKVVDDICVWGTTFDEMYKRVRQVLEKCKEHSITLSPKKLQFGRKSLKYVGYVISGDGIEADPKKLEAIQDFKIPKTKKQLKSFIGMCNQIAGFSSDYSKVVTPLRDNLKKNKNFLWTSVHTDAFENVKKLLMSPPVLSIFDPSKPTRLEVDASRNFGLGYDLLQKHEDGTWRLVECGSRFLTDTESRWPMVELESLAIYWAIKKKLRIYLAGLDTFEVVTDHRPLLSIYNQKMICDIENAKLQRHRMNLQEYRFNVTWQKGQLHSVADYLSRHPVKVEHDETDDEDDEILPLAEIAILHLRDEGEKSEENDDLMIKKLRNIAKEDDEYNELIQTIQSDFKNPMSEAVKAFKGLKDQLSVEEGLVLYGRRIVIPREYRKETLDQLHTAHLGETKSILRAMETVFWPGINNEIRQRTQACKECAKRQNSHANEPLMQEEIPKYPFEVASTDIFTHAGNKYLVMSDRLSGYPFIAGWKRDPTSKDVKMKMSEWFSIVGIPKTLNSDGGPQYSSREFKAFLEDNNINWRCSSPYNSRSNGAAEQTVKELKRLLQKTDAGRIDSIEFQEGLMELRNTPRTHGMSPASIVFGHFLRTRLPSGAKIEFQLPDKVHEKMTHNREKTKTNHDNHAVDLKPLRVGERVRIQDAVTKLWSNCGVIVKANERKRSYQVKMDNGSMFWRNRRYIRLSSDPQGEDMIASEDAQPQSILRRNPERSAKQKTLRFKE